MSPDERGRKLRLAVYWTAAMSGGTVSYFTSSDPDFGVSVFTGAVTGLAASFGRAVGLTMLTTADLLRLPSDTGRAPEFAGAYSQSCSRQEVNPESLMHTVLSTLCAAAASASVYRYVVPVMDRMLG